MWRVRRTWRPIFLLVLVAGSCGDPGVSSPPMGSFGPVGGGGTITVPPNKGGAFSALCFNNAAGGKVISLGGATSQGGVPGEAGSSGGAPGLSGSAGESADPSQGGDEGAGGSANTAGNGAGAADDLDPAGGASGAWSTGASQHNPRAPQQNPAHGGAPSSTGSGGQGGFSDSCPESIPIPLDQGRCETPTFCEYVDGTTCECAPCEGGLCWVCQVAPVPFGCPGTLPLLGDRCHWVGVSCRYPVCDPDTGTAPIAACCNGTWSVGSIPCFPG